jgi:hypothetical protein
LAEGRYTVDFIEEMRGLPFFDVLYECKFPERNEFSKGGYRQLISEDMLKAAFITEEEFERDYCTREIRDEDGNLLRRIPEGQAKGGADFAGAGRDRTAYVVRWPKVMKLISTNRFADTMAQVPIIEDILRDYMISASDMGLDYGGLGQGIGDRMNEKDIYTNNIMFGQSPPEGEPRSIYKNMRAFMYYEFYQWVKDGGKIVADDSFLEFLSVNYKEDSERKFQIQPKEELKKVMRDLGMTVSSPDIPDAAVLTFASSDAMVTEDDIDIL